MTPLITNFAKMLDYKGAINQRRLQPMTISSTPTTTSRNRQILQKRQRDYQRTLRKCQIPQRSNQPTKSPVHDDTLKTNCHVRQPPNIAGDNNEMTQVRTNIATRNPIENRRKHLPSRDDDERAQYKRRPPKPEGDNVDKTVV